MGITKKIDKYMGIEKDANIEYRKRYKSILSNLDKLKHIMLKHSLKQAKEPMDWGYAGDLEYIDDELSELIKNFK